MPKRGGFLVSPLITMIIDHRDPERRERQRESGSLIKGVGVCVPRIPIRVAVGPPLAGGLFLRKPDDKTTDLPSLEE